MAESEKYSLKEKLLEADQKYMGSPALLGMTALTYPKYINSMRSTMFTSHLKQFLNLQHPEFPIIFTGAENTVGGASSGYKKTKANYTVYKKVAKFDDILETPNVYKLFLYDADSDTYTVESRRPVEDLTENFGYDYINDEIDKYEEGDKIKKDTVLYRSTSYDDVMNYSYGRNPVVMYTLEPFTSEDAAVASEDFANIMTSIETEEFPIGLNQNDYLLNIYGDDDEYKPLPDIGETVSGFICAYRRMFKKQQLYDFTHDALKVVREGDQKVFCDKDTEIIDYTFYINIDEIPDSPFYEQIKRYVESQDKYFTTLRDTCDEIMHSGSNYTSEIEYLFKRSTEFMDTDKKWKEGDAAFSNMVIGVTTRKVAPLKKGSKVTFRYGNKSVISDVRPVKDMPYTEDGRPVDLMISLLGIVNRTTSFPLEEIFLTSTLYKMRQRMKVLKTYKEKEILFFDIINDINEVDYQRMWKDYSVLDAKDKEIWLDEVIEYGINVSYPSLWESEPIFYRVRRILEKNKDWLKPDKLFINKWGRKIPILANYWIGQMYCIKLKQTDERGFIARSTGAINTKSLPTRSYKSRSHMEQASRNCIRFGEFESLNLSIGLLPEDIVLFHSMYRTAIKGRKDLIKIMFNDDSDEVIQNIDFEYDSIVGQFFDVILKSLSLEVDYLDDDHVLRARNNSELKNFSINGKTFMCTEYEFYLIQRIYEIRDIVTEDTPVITIPQLIEKVKEELENQDFVSGDVNDIFDSFSLDTLLH